jgi:HK97 gp10 family phage protein
MGSKAMAEEALRGVSQTLAQINALGGLAKPTALRAAVKAGMTPALNAARPHAPVGHKAHKTYKGNWVQPGFGRDSVHIETHVSVTKEIATALLGPSKEGFYLTQFLEHGTKYIDPKKFAWLLPSFRGSLEQCKTALANSLKDSLGKLIRAAG